MKKGKVYKSMNSIYRNICECCVCCHTHGLSGKLQRVVAWKGAEGQEYDLIFFYALLLNFHVHMLP